MMVQTPGDFDLENACLVAAPSSGSRGVYGAVAPIGEWALNRGFAVAYTDKGTGVGASLRAAEEDWQDLIDAVVASEPAVQWILCRRPRRQDLCQA
jgi:hydroxybutyrate-dimer hydrolase